MHLCGLNERDVPIVSGLFMILWERRNVLFPASQRENDDAAWMRGDGKRDLLHNLTSFPTFRLEFDLCELPKYSINVYKKINF